MSAPKPHAAPHHTHPLASSQVCLSVLGNLATSLSASEKKDIHAIEAKLGKFCEKPANERDTKFCYFVDPIKRDISQPLKNGVPPAVVCDRLKKKAPEVCTLRYGAAPQAATITRASDLSKLRVKDLKAFIAEKSISCSPCVAQRAGLQQRRVQLRRARAGGVPGHAHTRALTPPAHSCPPPTPLSPNCRCTDKSDLEAAIQGYWAAHPEL